MSKDNIIKFAEVEYRPQGLSNQDGAEFKLTGLLRKRPNPRVMRLRDAESEEVELVQLQRRETRNALSKAPGMLAMGRVHENNDRVENSLRARATTFV